jgi:cytochrome c oxidase cbb3-type subunit 2
MVLQANPDSGGDVEDFQRRYPKAQVRDFDGKPSELTEMDALVAYLQMLGTLVDVGSAAAQERLAEEKGR